MEILWGRRTPGQIRFLIFVGCFHLQVLTLENEHKVLVYKKITFHRFPRQTEWLN